MSSRQPPTYPPCFPRQPTDSGPNFWRQASTPDGCFCHSAGGSDTSGVPELSKLESRRTWRRKSKASREFLFPTICRINSDYRREPKSRRKCISTRLCPAQPSRILRAAKVKPQDWAPQTKLPYPNCIRSHRRPRRPCLVSPVLAVTRCGVWAGGTCPPDNGYIHLAIPGKRPLTVPGKWGRRRVRRLLHINVTLDGPQDQIRVCIYISEVKAQKLAVTPPPAIARRISDCWFQQVCGPQAATYPARPTAQAASDRPRRNPARTISGIRFAKTAGHCSTGFHHEDAGMAGAWIL